jgi:hypothetical protein
MVSSSRWPAHYETRIEQAVDGCWPEWFEGLEVRSDGPETTLASLLPDASAFYGVLAKVRDRGVDLIGLRRLESD